MTSMPISWGLDRLDQEDLPLDSRFNTKFNGQDSNIFIVDSGIDTTHIEFQGSDRVVRNLFDVYSNEPPPDNDFVGHGTHTAATAAGAYAGVAPGANVYGVRVLDENGAGTDVEIIKGLSFVLDWCVLPFTGCALCASVFRSYPL